MRAVRLLLDLVPELLVEQRALSGPAALLQAQRWIVDCLAPSAQQLQQMRRQHEVSVLAILVQMVAAEIGITLMPQIAVVSEFASTRNIVTRPLSPDKPFRTLVLAWRPTSSRGVEFRMLGSLIRECMNVTKRAFAPERDAEALPAR
jgi:DNA-binding transcriptional LysR family regulator